MPQKPSCIIFSVVSLGTVFITLSLLLKLFIFGSDPSTSIPVADNPHDRPKDLTLRFKKDGTFQIAVFEDLHFGEGCLVFRAMTYLVLILLQPKTRFGVWHRM